MRFRCTSLPAIAMTSPIMLMGGYLGNTDQWNAFNSDWQSLLKAEGIEYSHGKDLHHAAKQFQGWPCKRRDGFPLKAHRIVDQHLELGVTAILRQNDYKDLYKGQPNPRKLRKDSITTQILYVVSIDVVNAFFPPSGVLLLKGRHARGRSEQVRQRLWFARHSMHQACRSRPAGG
jgi:hypothetical protein